MTRSADILQQLANEDEASQFLEMLNDSGLNQTLASEADGGSAEKGTFFTLFVPTNRAFTKMAGPLVANVTSNKVLLTKVLENHIIRGQRLIIDDLKDMEVVMTNMAGSPLRINQYRKSKFYRVSRMISIVFCFYAFFHASIFIHVLPFFCILLKSILFY